MRSILALPILFFLACAPVSAQIYDTWEVPRNTLTLPVAAPTAVDIHLEQEKLYSMELAGNPMMLGGIAGALLMNKIDNQNDRQTSLADTLQAGMPAQDYALLLHRAFEKHIGPGQLANITRVTVHREGPIDAAQRSASADANEQTLALNVRYYLAPGARNLRIVMTARLGPRGLVTTAPQRNQRPDFSQILVYDVPGVQKEFAKEAVRTKVWTDMGPAAIADHVAAGMDGVMAMLAVELAERPRFGRLPGKQVPWGEAASNTYGIAVGRLADRVLVRLRSGILVSLPGNDSRVQHYRDEVAGAARVPAGG